MLGSHLMAAQRMRHAVGASRCARACGKSASPSDALVAGSPNTHPLPYKQAFGQPPVLGGTA